MKRFTYILCLLIFVYSCKSKKTTYSKRTKTTKTVSNTKSSKEANNIIKYAKSFLGTRYKFGGTTKKGMDCSGLVHTSFKKHNIILPRTSSAMSTKGNWIDVKKINEGDLIFFATKKNSRKINHVGIVTKARAGHVEFIHASTSKGVIISSLAEKYWYFAYVQARRILK